MLAKKINLFNVINGVIAIFCAVTLCVNYVSINILNNDRATSKIGDDTFKYQSSNNSFLFIKNDKLTGFIPTDNKLIFKSTFLPSLKCNAAVVVGKGLVAGAGALATGAGGAAAWGTATASMAADASAIAGGAATVASAVAPTVMPAAGVAEATAGGAGVAAAEAATAAAAETAAIGSAALATLGAIAGAALVGAGLT